MSTDPYEISDAYLVDLPAEAVGVVSGLRSDLRRVGFFQRWIMVSLTLLIIAFFVWAMALAAGHGASGLTLLLELLVLSAVPPAYMIAAAVYEDRWIAATLALLACVPGINMFVVIGINSKAITVLNANGIGVGFFGAELSEI